MWSKNHGDLDDFTDGTFADAQGEGLSIYRRNLQRAYVTRLINEVEGASATSDLPGLARAQLEKITMDLRTKTTSDDAASAHRRDLLARIADALDGD